MKITIQYCVVYDQLFNIRHQWGRRGKESDEDKGVPSWTPSSTAWTNLFYVELGQANNTYICTMDT